MTMTLAAEEFMRRFLLCVSPGGFNRICNFAMIANNGPKEKNAYAWQLPNAVPVPSIEATFTETTPDEAELGFRALRSANDCPGICRAWSDDSGITFIDGGFVKTTWKNSGTFR